MSVPIGVIQRIEKRFRLTVRCPTTIRDLCFAEPLHMIVSEENIASLVVTGLHPIFSVTFGQWPDVDPAVGRIRHDHQT